MSRSASATEVPPNFMTIVPLLIGGRGYGAAPSLRGPGRGRQGQRERRARLYVEHGQVAAHAPRQLAADRQARARSPARPRRPRRARSARRCGRARPPGSPGPPSATRSQALRPSVPIVTSTAAPPRVAERVVEQDAHDPRRRRCVGERPDRGPSRQRRPRPPPAAPPPSNSDATEPASSRSSTGSRRRWRSPSRRPRSSRSFVSWASRRDCPAAAAARDRAPSTSGAAPASSSSSSSSVPCSEAIGVRSSCGCRRQEALTGPFVLDQPRRASPRGRGRPRRPRRGCRRAPAARRCPSSRSRRAASLSRRSRRLTSLVLRNSASRTAASSPAPTASGSPRCTRSIGRRGVVQPLVRGSGCSGCPATGNVRATVACPPSTTFTLRRRRRAGNPWRPPPRRPGRPRRDRCPPGRVRGVEDHDAGAGVVLQAPGHEHESRGAGDEHVGVIQAKPHLLDPCRGAQCRQAVVLESRTQRRDERGDGGRQRQRARGDERQDELPAQTHVARVPECHHTARR